MSITPTHRPIGRGQVIRAIVVSYNSANFGVLIALHTQANRRANLMLPDARTLPRAFNIALATAIAVSWVLSLIVLTVPLFIWSANFWSKFDRYWTAITPSDWYLGVVVITGFVTLLFVWFNILRSIRCRPLHGHLAICLLFVPHSLVSGVGNHLLQFDSVIGFACAQAFILVADIFLYIRLHREARIEQEEEAAAWLLEHCMTGSPQTPDMHKIGRAHV